MSIHGNSPFGGEKIDSSKSLNAIYESYGAAMAERKAKMQTMRSQEVATPGTTSPTSSSGLSTVKSLAKIFSKAKVEVAEAADSARQLAPIALRNAFRLMKGEDIG